MSSDLTRLLCQGFLWLYWRQLLIVCNQPAKFGGCSHCGSGDRTYLICHVILQDYEFKGSCYFMEGSSSLSVIALSSLMARGIVILKILYFNLSCGLTWPRVQRTVGLYKWNILTVSYLLAKFNGHRPCGSRDIRELIFHMTLQDHVIKEPSDFMEGSSSLCAPILLSLVVMGVVVAEKCHFYKYSSKRSTLNNIHREKLTYSIQYKNLLKQNLGCFWSFPYVYTIN